VTVEVSRYAVKTHEYRWMPPRSPTTVGMAVETTVISIAAIERLKSSATTVRGRLVFNALSSARPS
jgi:hypothetical protein